MPSSVVPFGADGAAGVAVPASPARDDLVAQLLVGVFAPAVLERQLDLAPLAEEAADVAELHLVVVLVDVGVELDLLDDDLGLVLAGLLLALAFVVAVLAEVHDPADRRVCARGNLDEIEVGVLRNTQGVTGFHDPGLGPVREDDADAGDADLVVGANERAGDGV